METCPFMTISALQWYPTQINGHKYRGHNGDFFQLPDALLPVPAATSADCRNLSRIQLTEFKTEQWLLTNDTVTAVNGKVGNVILSRFNYLKAIMQMIAVHFTQFRIFFKQQMAALSH